MNLSLIKRKTFAPLQALTEYMKLEAGKRIMLKSGVSSLAQMLGEKGQQN